MADGGELPVYDLGAKHADVHPGDRSAERLVEQLNHALKLHR